MTNQELKSGVEFLFNNELECTELEASFSRGRYTMFFEGKIIYSSKTFVSFEKKLESTIRKYSLVEA